MSDQSGQIGNWEKIDIYQDGSHRIFSRHLGNRRSTESDWMRNKIVTDNTTNYGVGHNCRAIYGEIRWIMKADIIIVATIGRHWLSIDTTICTYWLHMELSRNNHLGSSPSGAGQWWQWYSWRAKDQQSWWGIRNLARGCKDLSDEGSPTVYIYIMMKWSPSCGR